MLDHSLTIPNDDLQPWLDSLPSRAAVFALFGPEAHGDSSNSEPYISKTANLRRRMYRLLAPAFAGTKRLHLGGRAVRLAYSEVGSEFATSYLMLQAMRAYCGDRVREHLHLRPPSLLRLTSENPYPRVYVTNRIAQRALDSIYGPFPSRAAAERFLDESLNFFDLRRCAEELHPDPAFPGCVYSEMKMCLAPCFRGCTDERYAEESQRVREYLASRGARTIAECEQERDAASAALDFEKAARLHQRVQKMKAVAQLAAPLVHPLAELDAIILQPSVAGEGPQNSTTLPTPAGPEKLSNRALRTEASHVAVFLVRAGRIVGPEFYSVEGMRHPNERAGSTSLFAHPTLLEPTPLETSAATSPPVTTKLTRGHLEQRLQSLLEELEIRAKDSSIPTDQLAEHLSLLTRWYYRQPARRTGEIFFRDGEHGGRPAQDQGFPLSRILRGISRVFCGQKELPENRDAATTIIAGEAAASGETQRL